MIKFFRSILKNPWLIILSILGLLFRLYLATYPGFKYDIGSFFYWAVRLTELPLNQFYSPEVFTDYTPGYLYVLSVLGHIRATFNLSDDQFYFLLKIPSILAEICLGFIVYFVARRNELSQKLSLTFASSVFFNPGMIFNSSIWGQADGFFTLPLVLSVLFLKGRRFLLSGLFLGISFLIKPQAIAIFPIFVLIALKNFEVKNWLKFSVVFLISLFLLTLPFFPNNPLWNLKEKIVSTANEYPYTALGPYNFWGTVGYWINDTITWFYGIVYQTWGYILLASFWLVTMIVYFKKNIPIFTLAALATMAFYFLPTRVHERYLYPALVFLILAAIEFKSEIILYAQDLLSVIYFINLYRVYVYYNEEVLHLPQSLLIPPVYDFLAKNDKMFSQWTTLFFVIISIYLFAMSLKKGYTENHV